MPDSLLLNHSSLPISRVVHIGDLALGGNHPVRIQSMVNTPTLDTAATVAQCIRLVEAGCEMVRITAPGIREAENLANIKRELRKKGLKVPLIADIHFNPKAAEVAAQIVEKVRINPGNYIDRRHGKADFSEAEYRREQEKIAERLSPLLAICKTNGTAIRIGTNYGSLSERILAKYGNTPQGMVESAMEFVHVCRDFGFQNLVLSMKASRVKIMMEANYLLVERMIESGYYLPIHLGLTEAGSGEEARVKSAAGIGSLLASGIGNTIRVSLAEAPEAELPLARQLVKFYARNAMCFPKQQARLSRFFSEQGLEVLKMQYPGLAFDELLIRSAVDFTLSHQKSRAGGILITNCQQTDDSRLTRLGQHILQALGIRHFRGEFIACPSCGRTQFNLIEELEKVKRQTSHLKDLSIAVMGCIVNGPGEMAEADYGYVGAGPGKVTIYKGKTAVLKNIEANRAVHALIKLIKTEGDWVEESKP
ncbi:MAG: (E)-4-hydroxy-3-methylbut-2-enyl-diphosphate synthase [Bacteroidales bacterium]|nr:(E)-4-hydroxy-3-methylbut-2-enyl-diphosphate synthase [Bacteroidales bacterium]MCF6343034.1 (E)-4-hydroxy-3-methylbut-2-enyl-diphosphate synthase [Bacteroidales bacterium]